MITASLIGSLEAGVGGASVRGGASIPMRPQASMSANPHSSLHRSDRYPRRLPVTQRASFA